MNPGQSDLSWQVSVHSWRQEGPPKSLGRLKPEHLGKGVLLRQSAFSSPGASLQLSSLDGVGSSSGAAHHPHTFLDQRNFPPPIRFWKVLCNSETLESESFCFCQPRQ